jgi:hypothetical protein
VPFLGHSLFAEHFMPTLFLLLPVYWLWQSPVALLVLQLIFIAAAAGRAAPARQREAAAGRGRCADGGISFSRRTHSGLEAWFHNEGLEPLLVFRDGVGGRRARWVWYWVCLLLALGARKTCRCISACLVRTWWSAGPERLARSRS